jgi:hypothetical protein
MFKKFVMSMFIVATMIVAGVGVESQLVLAYEGESEDEFVSRVFFSNWMEVHTGTYFEYTRENAEIPEIISCDPVSETAKIVVRAKNDRSFVTYDYIFTNGKGGYGLMVFKDRGMTENAMDLVRMDF